MTLVLYYYIVLTYVAPLLTPFFIIVLLHDKVRVAARKLPTISSASNNLLLKLCPDQRRDITGADYNDLSTFTASQKEALKKKLPDLVWSEWTYPTRKQLLRNHIRCVLLAIPSHIAVTIIDNIISILLIITLCYYMPKLLVLLKIIFILFLLYNLEIIIIVKENYSLNFIAWLLNYDLIEYSDITLGELFIYKDILKVDEQVIINDLHQKMPNISYCSKIDLYKSFLLSFNQSWALRLLKKHFK